MLMCLCSGTSQSHEKLLVLFEIKACGHGVNYPVSIRNYIPVLFHENRGPVAASHKGLGEGGWAGERTYFPGVSCHWLTIAGVLVGIINGKAI